VSGSPAYVYVLQSDKNGRHYVGCSVDPQRRLAEHNAGESQSTRGRGPWRLVHLEAYGTLTAARQREQALKRKKSAAYLSRLVAGAVPQPG
jgi:putative endonuclease